MIWKWGTAVTLIFNSISSAANTIFSIWWFVFWNFFLPSLGWWDAGLMSLSIGGRLNPIGIALLVAQIAIQTLIFMAGLQIAGCI